MPEPPFLSRQFFSVLADFWAEFLDRPTVHQIWDGYLQQVGNLFLQLYQADMGKSLDTVLVYPRSSNQLFIFDETNHRPDKSLPGFSMAFQIPRDVVSLPHLEDKINGSGTITTELKDHVVSDGIAYFKLDRQSRRRFDVDGSTFFSTAPAAGPLNQVMIDESQIVYADRASPPQSLTTIPLSEENFAQFGGSQSLLPRQMFHNRETVYSNFGFPVDFVRTNSLSYLRAVQGLWYALWTGPQVRNIELGLTILSDFPFIESGTLQEIVPVPGGATRILVFDNIEIEVPTFMPLKVSAGQTIEEYTALIGGWKVFDYVNNPNFVANLGLLPVMKLFNFFPTVPVGIVWGMESLTGQVYDFTPVRPFLEKIKPSYTQYIILINIPVADTLDLFVQPAEINLLKNCSATVDDNYVNHFILPDFVATNLSETEYISATNRVKEDNDDSTSSFSTAASPGGSQIIVSENSVWYADSSALRPIPPVRAYDLDPDTIYMGENFIISDIPLIGPPGAILYQSPEP